MLPIPSLPSEPGSLDDPHQQWARLSSRLAEDDRTRLEAAFRLASRVHATQWRKASPDSPPIPYVVHPVRVGCILAHEWNVTDSRTLEVALLHDVLEDCPPDQQSEFADEIERSAGRDVLEAVWSLTKPFLPAVVPAETRARRDAEYFRIVRKAPSWVRLVKCADRVDNLRDALRWGDREFWAKYSSETIGWHLFLARETAPIAEVALFKVLVGGERQMNGRAPIWVDGHLVDPSAARLVPEHIARHYGVVGLARRGATLVIGAAQALGAGRLTEIRRAINSAGQPIRAIELLPISAEALADALAAKLYGTVDDQSQDMKT
jgi:hypothetical protein